jgi:hypothetical protein
MADSLDAEEAAFRVLEFSFLYRCIKLLLESWEAVLGVDWE